MKNGTIQIEGVEYEWSVYRQPRWTGDGIPLGLAILVKAVKASGRELVLEFVLDPKRPGDMQQHQQGRVANRRLTVCIQNAMTAGWDPESRGKPFFFTAGPVHPNSNGMPSNPARKV